MIFSTPCLRRSQFKVVHALALPIITDWKTTLINCKECAALFDILTCKLEVGLLLTRLALPKDFVLMVGPLANVEIEGKRVPPKAISTSFGGCLKLDRKHEV